MNCGTKRFQTSWWPGQWPTNVSHDVQPTYMSLATRQSTWSFPGWLHSTECNGSHVDINAIPFCISIYLLRFWHVLRFCPDSAWLPRRLAGHSVTTPDRHSLQLADSDWWAGPRTLVATACGIHREQTKFCNIHRLETIDSIWFKKIRRKNVYRP